MTSGERDVKLMSRKSTRSEGEKEDVGNASTEPLPSLVDILDIRVARKQGESESDGEAKSSIDGAERIRPNLAKEAAKAEATRRRAKARKGGARVARGTQQGNKGKKPASGRSSESESSDSSESDSTSESSSSESSEEEPTRKRASSESDSSGVKKGRSDRGKRAKVGRPKKQAKKENIQKVSAFGAAIDKGKRSEASLVAPVQCAIVQARLHKKAKIADGQSDIGKKKGEQASGTAR